MQGDFYQTEDRECIAKMFFILYQVVGHPQATVGVLGWEIILPKMGKSPQNGKISVELGGI